MSIGMTLGLDFPSIELILNGRFVPPVDRGAARLVSFNGDSLAKQGVKLSWSSEVVGMCGNGNSPSCGPVGFSGVPA